MKRLAGLCGIREVLFVGGLGAFSAGIFLEYGMSYGLISAGAVMLFVAVKGIS